MFGGINRTWLAESNINRIKHILQKKNNYATIVQEYT